MVRVAAVSHAPSELVLSRDFSGHMQEFRAPNKSTLVSVRTGLPELSYSKGRRLLRGLRDDEDSGVSNAKMDIDATTWGQATREVNLPERTMDRKIAQELRVVTYVVE